MESSKLKSSIYPKLRNKLSSKNRVKSQPDELKENWNNSVSSSFKRNANDLEHLPETNLQSEEEHTLKLSGGQKNIISDNISIKITSDNIFRQEFCDPDNLNVYESLFSGINDVKNVDNIGESIQEITNKEYFGDSNVNSNSRTPDEVLQELNNSDISVEHDANDCIKYSSDLPIKKYHICPLCWKKFENYQSQISHMKVCAVKHNVTSRQLLDAIELHAKQTAERLALGLPDISNVQPVQKCQSRKNTGKNDDNLQLALALSVSMQEAEEIELFQQDTCLLEADLDHEVVDQQSILESFGFTNSCPPLQALRNARSTQSNNKINIAPKLMSRTREEREKCMAEMVAMILMEDENKSVEDTQDTEDTIHLSNKHLYQDKERRSNMLSDGVLCYGTPDRPFDFEKTCSKIGILKNKKYRQNHTGVPSKKSTSKISLAERLINDWKALLNNKFMSDLTIYVENDDVIPAHKLVLYARCRAVLKDVVSEVSKNKKKDILIWIDLSFNAALAFLQFLYCGLTRKIICLNEDDLLSIKRLAQKYQVTELLKHLKALDSVRFRVENTKNGSSISSSHDETICNSVHLIPLLKHSDMSQHKLKNSGNSVSSKSSDARGRGAFKITHGAAKQDSWTLNNIKESQQHGNGSTSPDLFIKKAEMNKVLEKTSEESKNNLKYLLNLIRNSLSQSISQTVTGLMTSDKVCRSPEMLSPFRGSYIASSPEFQCTHPNNEITCDKQDNITNKCDSLTSTESFLKPKISSSDSYTDTSDLKKTDNSIDKHEIYQQDIHIEGVPRKDFQENVQQTDIFDKVDYLEALLSESPNKARDKQTSVEAKRKHSGNTSSDCCSPFSKKSCREDGEIKSYFCEETDILKNFTNEVEMLDLTQGSNDSPCGEPLNLLSSSSSSFVKNTSCYKNNESDAKCDAETFVLKNVCKETCNTVDAGKNSLDSLNCDKSEILASNVPILWRDNMNKEVDHANVKLPVNSLVEDDWDVFDEMCAVEPKIFSQCLTQLISRELKSKASLSSEVIENESHKSHNSYVEEQSLSFIAQLNESLFWRDENAPTIDLSPKLEMIKHEDITDHRTPKQKKQNAMNSNQVTPLANYSTMKTPELKKELQKYGLKPSLTKKKAKIMLKYIYDQLHPYITGSDSDDTVNCSKGLSVKTAGLDVCVLNNTERERNIENLAKPVGSPARRNILTSKDVLEKSYSCTVICNKSTQCSRDLESELSLSQETSSSSLPSVSETFCEDLEYFSQQDTAPIQDECTSMDLASLIKDYITSNPDLHRKVLLYTPIWFEDLYTEMKTNKFNFKVNHLMDYLDEQGITVRTCKSQQNRQKKKLKQVTKKQKMKRNKHNNKSPSHTRINRSHSDI